MNDDYISREQAIAALQDTINDPACPIFIAAYVEQILSQLPAADVVPGRWIPVEERLPEDMQETLCCFDDGFIATATYMVKYKDWELWQDAGEVTHWMPLPEPPEEGDLT